MTIPARNIVSVNPGVISSGGNPLSLNGVFISISLDIPVGGPVACSSQTEVGNVFGTSSVEYEIAGIYFNGYDNSTLKPGLLYFMRLAYGDLPPVIFGGNLGGTTLAELQALSGSLEITVNGTPIAENINLSAASSFSNAATLLTTAFSGDTPAIVFTWDPTFSRFLVSPASETGDGNTIDFATTGVVATGLGLTSATGAKLQQGFDSDTIVTVMSRMVQYSQNWLTFSSTVEPDISFKQQIASWATDQNNRYVYVAWDTDSEAIVQNSTSNFGYLAREAEYNAAMPVYNTLNVAAFIMGMVASIDFSRENGRITAAFKHQSGLDATVTDSQISENLLANGYSFYGTYGTANDEFTFLYNGQISGQWKWLDSFVNQVWVNNQFQLALMTLLTQVTAVPYVADGYALIGAAMQDPINAFKNFGGFSAGVSLSSLQKAEVNSAAGKDISMNLEQQGYYLQILDPGSIVRGQRGSPVVTFWYTDGGAVQKLNVASVDIM